jgi:hypothetical protein
MTENKIISENRPINFSEELYLDTFLKKTLEN